MNQYRDRKGLYFRGKINTFSTNLLELNKEPLEDDLHSQFQSLLVLQNPVINGDGGRRSDPLYKIGNTDSTQASDAQNGIGTSRTSNFMPSARGGGGLSLTNSKYRPLLEEIEQEKEILESSVDPLEWKKECDRVGA